MRSLIKELGYFLLFIAVYVLWNPQALEVFTTQFYGGSRGDPGIYVWLTWDSIQHVLRYPSSFFDAPVFYPYGYSRAYTDNYILPSTVSLIASWFVHNKYVLYNLPLLLAAGLNGYAAFCLARTMLRSIPAALISGVVFGLQPFFYYQSGHPQMQYAFFIVFAAQAVLYFCQKRTLLSATAIGACVTGSFLCAVYYSMYTYFLSGALLATYGLLRQKTITRKDIATLCLGLAPWIVVLFFFSEPYRQVREVFSPQPAAVVKHYSATPLAYLAAPPRNILWGRLTSSWSRLEAFLFPGFLSLLFALVSIVSLYVSVVKAEAPGRFRRLLRRSALSLPVLIIGLFVFHACLPRQVLDDRLWLRWLVSIPMWLLSAVSLAMLISLARHQKTKRISHDENVALACFMMVVFMFLSFGIQGTHSSHLLHPEPYWYVYSYLPGFDGLRATARIGVVALLWISILAGAGALKLFDSLRKWSVRKPLYLAVCILLISFELDMISFHSAAEPEPAKIYKDFNSRTEPGAVLGLPYGSPLREGIMHARVQTEFMRWLQASGRPMVNGYSGKMPPYHQRLDDKLFSFPDRESVNVLSRIIGLRWILFSRRYQTRPGEAEFEKRVRKLSPSLELLQKTKRGFLLEFKPEVRVSKVPGQSFLVPPDTKCTRSLSFELFLPKEEAGHKSFPVAFNNVDAGVDDIGIVLVPEPGSWQPRSIEVPESTTRVLPTEIVFHSPHKSALRVRNFNVSSCPDKGFLG